MSSHFALKRSDFLTTARDRLIHIHRCNGITRRMIREMFRFDPSLGSIHSLSHQEIMNRFSIPSDKARSFLHDLHDSTLTDAIQQDLKRYSILTIVDDNYPFVLKTIKDPPYVLYALGDIGLLTDIPALSVIGTRNPSREAISKLQLVITRPIEENWVIVSGMAKGIDSYAHKLALDMQGKTIAVLGGGFHHIYPRQNIPLFHRLTKHGLVLSEYPPSVRPERFHFPERNRIISGLSFGTLVLEATERSGTLITVDAALDQGREVYAVPGSPTVSQSKGCNRMIQDGAMLISDAQDIIKNWEMIKPSWNFQMKNQQQKRPHL